MAKRAIEPSGQDRELALAQAVISALSRQQTERVYGASDGAVQAHLLARLAALKNAAAEQPADEQLAERAAALQLAQRAANPFDRVLPVAEVVLKIVGWIWLGSGLLAIALAFVFGGMPANDQDGWTFSGISGVLIAVCIAAFPIAGALLVVRNILHRRRERRVRSALIAWAVERPGQLARGLPGLVRHRKRRARSVSSDAPASPLVTVAMWAFGVIGAFGVATGGVSLLVGLLPPQNWEFVAVMAVWLVVSLLLVGLAVFLHRWSGHAARHEALLVEGLEWVYEDRFEQIDDQHRADPGVPELSDAHQADSAEQD